VFAPAPVHVYVIDGVDPFGWAGMRAVADRIRSSGYETRFGGWYQARQFEREIRSLHAQQPGTQFAIIGYSFGVYQAKAVANRLTRDGIPVAMVGYVGGDYLRNSSSDVPAGPQVVNVRGNGYLLTGRNLFFNGTDLTGAQNVRLSANHFVLPKQQETLDALLAGLGSPGVMAASPSFPAGTMTAIPGQPVTAPGVPGTSSTGAGGGSQPPGVAPAGAFVPKAAEAPAPPRRRSTSPAAAASRPYAPRR
jgi:hypothetical protein